MSSTARATGASPATAPWREAFLEHVTQKMASPEFVLSTLTPAPKGSPTPYLPRARYCIFRGMWASLPENKHNDAPKNPPAFESDCPTLTTDVRMEKVGQVFSSSAGHAETDEQASGSGGGGPVEAVWWVKDASIQWRIRGEAFLVGPDIEGGKETESSGVRTTKSEIGKRMRLVDQSKEGEWSWEREVTGHFGNISPGMRGMFKAPPPGLPKDKPFDDKHEKPGEKVGDLDDETARKNFRVMIIRPEEVEMLNLAPDNQKRIHYNYQSDSGTWTSYETWA